MSERIVARDERTVSVENTSYRWAYLFLSFGLLLSTAYRAFVHGEQPWDLLGLVIVSGAITTAYQGNQRVLTRRWVMLSVAAVVAAMLIGAIMVLAIR